jgi:VIT1/CCC1 family predicted Fe2+/Mn2+ transporter
MITAFRTLADSSMSGSQLLHAIVYLIVVGLIFWLLWWIIGYAKVPEPFNKVLRVVLALVAVIFLINWLLGLIGEPFIRF